MIHLQRSKIPKDLNGKTSKAWKELEAWKKYYKAKDKTKLKKPKFSAYKARSVRDSLREIFHGKCSYCEARIFHITPEDIEHYRPKSAVLTSDGKTKLADGYWWLAADWENLLCACFICNRANYQVIYGSPLEQRVGKGIAFPLEEEKKRAKKPGQEAKEKPLLLNPCAKDPQEYPENHMTFGLEGELAGVPMAKVAPNGELDTRGETTIRVFGLRRTTLVNERKQRLLEIRDKMKDVEELLAKLDQAPDAATGDAILKRMEEKLAFLKMYRAEDAVYLLMARQVIDPFLAKIFTS